MNKIRPKKDLPHKVSRRDRHDGNFYLESSRTSPLERKQYKFIHLVRFIALVAFLAFGSSLNAQCITDYSPAAGSITECDGESLTLSVLYSVGGGLPTVNWEVDEGLGLGFVDISANASSIVYSNTQGGTNADLILTLEAAHTGFIYRAVFSGSCTDTSDVYTVNINGPFDILTPPMDFSICESTVGQTHDFSVTTSGSPNSRWQYRTSPSGPWTTIIGEDDNAGWNSTNLTLDSSSMDISKSEAIWPTAGNVTYLRYRAILGGCDPQFSDIAELKMDMQPVISITTDSINMCSDQTIAIAASGVNAVTTDYTWSGMTNGAFVASSGTLPAADEYTNTTAGVDRIYITSNTNGTCPVAVDSIGVRVTELTITSTEERFDFCAGVDAYFGNVTIEASTSLPVTVQWQSSTDGVTWTDGNLDEINAIGIINDTILAITATDDGLLSRAIITSGACIDTTTVDTIHVHGPLDITVQPVSVLDICDSQDSVTFDVTATTDAGEIEYLWQKRDDPNSGGYSNIGSWTIESKLTIHNGDSHWPADLDQGYRVRVRLKNAPVACNTIINSDQATLTLSPQTATIVDAGVDATICMSDALPYTLSGSISGQAAIANQGTWTASAGTFLDAANPTTDYTAPAPGIYTLVLTSVDPLGPCPVVTDTMFLTTIDSVIVMAGPDVSLCLGDTISLAGSITGEVNTGLWSSFTVDSPEDLGSLTSKFIPTVAGVTTLTLTSDVGAVCTTQKTDDVTITVEGIVFNGSTNPGSMTRTVCEGATTFFHHNFSVTPNSYTSTWYDQDGVLALGPDAVISNSNQRLTLHNVTLAMDGNTYYNVVQTPNGCLDTSAIFTLNVDVAPTAMLPADVTVCGGDTLDVIGIPGGDFASFSYALSGGSQPGSSIVDTNYTSAATSGIDTILYTVMANPGACSDVVDAMVVTINSLVIDSHSPGGTHIRNICEGGSTNFRVNYTASTDSSAVWMMSTDDGVSYSPVSIGTVDTPGGNTRLTIDPVELSYNGYKFLTVITAGECSVVSDTFTLNVGGTGTIDAGGPITICNVDEVINLSSTTTGGYPTDSVTWTGGSGVFDPVSGRGANISYYPSSSDQAVGTLTLTVTTDDPGICPVLDASVVVTFPAEDDIAAGPDALICSGSTHTLSGGVNGLASSVTWTTTGTGTFNIPNATNPIYTPSAADITAGMVKLIIKSNSPVGSCPSVSDTMELTIETIDIASHDPSSLEFNVCDGDDVEMSIVANTVAPASYQWYELTAGSIGGEMNDTLSLSTVSNSDSGNMYYVLITSGSCMASSDTFTLNVNGPVAFSAPSDVLNICESVTPVTFTTANGASTNGVVTYQWEYSTDNVTFSAVPSEGSVMGEDTLELVIENTASFYPGLGTEIYLRNSATVANCAVYYSDTATLSINAFEAAEVDAGTDIIAQCTTATVTLNGSVLTNAASSATWSGGAGVIFDPNSLTTTYDPTDAEQLAGSVDLYLTSNIPVGGVCIADKDTVTIFFNNVGTISAGPDQTICDGDAVTNLTGTIDAGNVAWTIVSGVGSLNGSTTMLTAEYLLPSAMVGEGTTKFEIRRTSLSATCPTIKDTVEVTYDKSITAGPDKNICTGETTTLGGNFQAPVQSGTWSIVSGGTGTFSDEHFKGSTFLPDGQGSYILKYESHALIGGACATVSDLMTVNVTGTDFTSYSPADLTLEKCAGGTASVTASFSSNPTGSTTRQWQRKQGSGSWVNYGSSSPGVGTSTSKTISNGEADAGNNGDLFRVIVSLNSCSDTSESIELVIPASVDSWVGEEQKTPQCSDLASAQFTHTYSFTSAGDASTFDTIWQYVVNAGTPPGSVDYVDVPSSVLGYNGATIDVMNGDAIWPAVGETLFLRMKVTTAVGGQSCVYTSPASSLPISQQAPTSNAGLDQQICAGETVSIDGDFGGAATSASWTAIPANPTGFVDPNALNGATVYTPSTDDIALGAVSLIYTTNAPGGVCTPASDTLNVVIHSVNITGANGITPTVCAGADKVFVVDFATPVIDSTEIVWEYNDGSGWADASAIGEVLSTINTYRTRLRVESIPITYNGHMFRATITTGTCPVVDTVFTLTVNPGPTADAGKDTTICAGTDLVLSGTVGGSATTGFWSKVSGQGDLSPNGTGSLDTLLENLLLAGVTQLLLSTDNPGGPCPVDTDGMTVYVEKIEITGYTPGGNHTRNECDGDAENFIVQYTAGGIAEGDTSIVWTYNGADISTTTISYTINNTTGQTELVINPITASLNGGKFRAIIGGKACEVMSDEFTLNVNGPAVVDVDPTDLLMVCQEEASVMFISEMSNTGAGNLNTRWQESASGTGGWSNVDFGSGNITSDTLLIENSNFPLPGGSMYYRFVGAISQCSNTFSDTVQLMISTDVFNEIAIDRSGFTNDTIDLCVNSDNAFAATSSGTSRMWTHNGSGSLDVPTSLIPTYTPGVDELGTVMFTVTANDPVGVCPGASDIVYITYLDSVSVDAGADVVICDNMGSFDPMTLNGLISGAASTGVWSNSGVGGFIDPNDLGTMFTPAYSMPAPADITLTLTSDASVCPIASDDLVISFADTISAVSYAPSSLTRTSCVGENNQDMTVEFSPNTLDVIRTWYQIKDGVTTVVADGGDTQILTPGSDDTRLRLDNITADMDSNLYYVVLESGTCTPFISDTFTLRVNGYTIETDSVAVCASETEQGFKANVTFTGPDDNANYLWSYSTDLGVSYDNYVSGYGVAGYNTDSLTLVDGDTGWPAVGDKTYLRVRVTSVDGCNTTFDTLAFVRDEDPTIDLGSDLIVCSSDTTTLTATVSGAVTDVSWSDLKSDSVTVGGGVFITTLSGLPTADYVNTVPGVYLIVSTTNDPTGECDAVSDTLMITIEEAPTVMAGDDFTGCAQGGTGGTITLNGTVAGGEATTTSEWIAYTGPGTPTYYDRYNDTTDVYLNAGVFNFILKVTPGGTLACPVTRDTVEVSVGNGFTGTQSTPAVTICAGSNTSLSVGSLTGLDAPIYTWSVDAGSGYNPISATIPNVASYTIASTGTSQTINLVNIASAADTLKMKLTIVDEGCVAEYFWTVTVNGELSTLTTPAYATVCVDATSANFTTVVTNSGNGEETLRWQYLKSGPGQIWTNVPATVAGYNGSTLFLTSGATSIWPAVGDSIQVRMRASLAQCGILTGNPAKLKRTGDPCGEADISPEYFTGGTSYNIGQTKNVVVRIRNVNPTTTSDSVTVYVNKIIPNFTINVDANAILATVGPDSHDLDNPDWKITEQGTRWKFVSKPGVAIPGFSEHLLGITLTANNFVGSTANLNTIIVGGSGGETTTTNNIKAAAVNIN